MNEDKYIYPIQDQLVLRSERETAHGHRAHVYWMTGLSGSGKSTIARGVERHLFLKGKKILVLDGDNIRSGINQDLGFEMKDREENIRRVAEIARLFASAGMIVIVSFISPTQSIRQKARNIIGEEDFSEVYVNASYETCAQRDVKGLYAKAARGEIKNFTGLDAPFEPPNPPDVLLNSETDTIESCIAIFANAIESKTRLH